MEITGTLNGKIIVEIKSQNMTDLDLGNFTPQEDFFNLNIEQQVKLIRENYIITKKDDEYLNKCLTSGIAFVRKFNRPKRT